MADEPHVDYSVAARRAPYSVLCVPKQRLESVVDSSMQARDTVTWRARDKSW